MFRGKGWIAFALHIQTYWVLIPSQLNHCESTITGAVAPSTFFTASLTSMCLRHTHLTAQWHAMAQLRFNSAMLCNGVTVCNGVRACNDAMAYYGVQQCNGATACKSSNNPETATIMLYGGIDGAIGGASSVDTDGNSVIWWHLCRWWGCCKAALACPWHLGRGESKTRGSSPIFLPDSKISGGNIGLERQKKVYQFETKTKSQNMPESPTLPPLAKIGN